MLLFSTILPCVDQKKGCTNCAPSINEFKKTLPDPHVPLHIQMCCDAVRCDVICARDLPSFMTQRQDEFQVFSEEPSSLEELEKKYIRFVLRRTKGKKTKAAEILGINRKTLGLKIKKYGIR